MRFFVISLWVLMGLWAAVGEFYAPEPLLADLPAGDLSVCNTYWVCDANGNAIWMIGYHNWNNGGTFDLRNNTAFDFSAYADSLEDDGQHAVRIWRPWSDTSEWGIGAGEAATHWWWQHTTADTVDLGTIDTSAASYAQWIRARLDTLNSHNVIGILNILDPCYAASQHPLLNGENTDGLIIDTDGLNHLDTLVARGYMPDLDSLVRRITRFMSDVPNLIIEVGNELGSCSTNAEFHGTWALIDTVAEIIHDEDPDRLVVMSGGGGDVAQDSLRASSADIFTPVNGADPVSAQGNNYVSGTWADTPVVSPKIYGSGGVVLADTDHYFQEGTGSQSICPPGFISCDTTKANNGDTALLKQWPAKALVRGHHPQMMWAGPHPGWSIRDTTTEECDGGNGDSCWAFAGNSVILPTINTMSNVGLFTDSIKDLRSLTPDYTTADNGYASAHAGSEYVVFFEEGDGSVDVTIKKGTYRRIWLDISSGEVRDSSTLAYGSGGEDTTVTFSEPYTGTPSTLLILQGEEPTYARARQDTDNPRFVVLTSIGTDTVCIGSVDPCAPGDSVPRYSVGSNVDLSVSYVLLVNAAVDSAMFVTEDTMFNGLAPSEHIDSATAAALCGSAQWGCTEAILKAVNVN